MHTVCICQINVNIIYLLASVFLFDPTMVSRTVLILFIYSMDPQVQLCKVEKKNPRLSPASFDERDAHTMFGPTN